MICPKSHEVYIEFVGWIQAGGLCPMTKTGKCLCLMQFYESRLKSCTSANILSFWHVDKSTLGHIIQSFFKIS